MTRWTTKKGTTTRRKTVQCVTCETTWTVHRSISRKYCSIACRNKDPQYIEMLKLAGKKAALRDTTGDKNPNWRGGTTAARHALMSRKEYKAWRASVYERDNYACVMCGTAGNGRNLNADHIKPYALHPELALDVDNGRTLCIDCHKETDTYGWRMFNLLRKMEKECQALV